MSTINEIIEGVGNAIGYTPDEIKSKSRIRELVLARHICYFIAYKEECRSFTVIGKEIGDRDHTTVIHGVNKIMDYAKTKDPLFMEYMKAIKLKSPDIYSSLLPQQIKHNSEPCNYSRFKITRHA